jgi:hypothetical protein
MTKEERERASLADRAYLKACEEKDVRVCSWQEFDAWQTFVDGKIDESQLEEKARLELEQYGQSFGRYLLMEQEEPVSTGDEGKKGRAKRAKQIYKTVCDERELTLCFFKNFAAWSEFVEGKMSDKQFYEKANLEVEKIKAQES